MTNICFTPIPTADAQALWAGGPDANGMAPERHVSDGVDVPCRHCLENVAAGDPYLIFAYRPFATPQPYAEVGPVFLHAGPCKAYAGGSDIPAMYLAGGEPRIVRGYGTGNRIVYGTGKVVPPDEIAGHAARLLSDPAIAYVHVRSAANNCYSCRVDRATVANAVRSPWV